MKHLSATMAAALKLERHIPPALRREFARLRDQAIRQAMADDAEDARLPDTSDHSNVIAFDPWSRKAGGQ